MLVANARKLRLIYASMRKFDEINAENLARLARLDSKLSYPLKHRGEGSQAHMAIVRSRQALVNCRTQLVNHAPKERSNPSGQPAQLPGQELPQEGFEAHTGGPSAGPGTHTRADRLADGAYPRVRAAARNRT